MSDNRTQEGQYRPFVDVRIYRPEGYEDVCDELVAVDAMDKAQGWGWEVLPNAARAAGGK